VLGHLTALKELGLSNNELTGTFDQHWLDCNW